MMKASVNVLFLELYLFGVKKIFKPNRILVPLGTPFRREPGQVPQKPYSNLSVNIEKDKT